jgi:ankyrin repeat protein
VISPAAMMISRAARCAALFICALAIVPGFAMTSANGAEREDRALLSAAARGDAVAVTRLLGEGGSVKAKDASGRSALLLATHGNHVEAARLLIAAGADVNAKDNIQDSPFLYAGAEGRNEILKMTMAAGADLKSTNRYGGTALIPAAHHGHVETVKILLATAIDRNHINRLGWTALLEAVILGDGGEAHTEIVRLLVDAGANVNIADRDGVTPLGHARQHGYVEIAKILEAEGAR